MANWLMCAAAALPGSARICLRIFASAARFIAFERLSWPPEPMPMRLLNQPR